MSAVLIIFLAILFFVLISLLGWFISGYNNLVNGQVNIKTQWSNIKTEYQRRADLFYSLLQNVKSHKNFERETLTKVIQARSGAFLNNGTKPQQAGKMKQLDNFFSKLAVTFERYPKLVSSELYKEFMGEIRITEDRINVARTSYNDIVRTYNIYVRSFPSNILAKMFSYNPEEFYLSGINAENKPILNFE